MGICKLCLQDRKLLKKSHIIPDFFYRESGVYTEKHQINKINVAEYTKSGKIGYVPTGEYEGEILCQNCDNLIIGTLEDYGRKVLFGGLKGNEALRYSQHRNPYDGFSYTRWYNVDYAKFKLFLLSILWRACISTRPAFSDAVVSFEDLENLRSMIFNNQPGNVYEYPIVFMTYLNDKGVPSDYIFSPLKGNHPDRPLITFLLGGFVFVFNITKKYPNLTDIIDITLITNGEYTIMNFPQGKAWDFILTFAGIKKYETN